jgi:hypothetical protein
MRVLRACSPPNLPLGGDPPSSVIYTSYAVIFQKRFKPAVIALLLPMFLLYRFFALASAKNDTQEQYRSAEGSMPTA